MSQPIPDALAAATTIASQLADPHAIGSVALGAEVALGRLPDIGLCHGMAGVFQTAWRMAADAHTPDIADELPRLAARLLTQFRSAPEEPEFLDGHAGVALALHTAGTDTAPLAHWDACLLLT